MVWTVESLERKLSESPHPLSGMDSKKRLIQIARVCWDDYEITHCGRVSRVNGHTATAYLNAWEVEA